MTSRVTNTNTGRHVVFYRESDSRLLDIYLSQSEKKAVPERWNDDEMMMKWWWNIDQTEFHVDRVVALYPETTATCPCVYRVNLTDDPGLQTVKRSSGHELNVRRFTNLPLGKKNYWCWKWGSTCIIMHIGFIGFFMDLLTAHYRCCCQLSIKGSIFNFWFPSGFAALSWTCVSWRCLTPPAGSAVISFFIRMENHSCVPTLEQGIDPVQRFTARVLLSGCVSEWMTGIIN